MNYSLYVVKSRKERNLISEFGIEASGLISATLTFALSPCNGSRELRRTL
jgi:hypothetical protein